MGHDLIDCGDVQKVLNDFFTAAGCHGAIELFHLLWPYPFFQEFFAQAGDSIP